MSPQNNLLNSALELIAEKGWHAFSLEALAETSNLSITEVQQIFPHKLDIMRAFRFKISELVYDNIPQAELLEVSPKERVLEMLLMRFEIMAPYKAAVKDLSHALLKSPTAYCAHMQGIERDIAAALDYSKIVTGGVLGKFKVKGTSVLYLEALRRWLSTPNMSIDQLMAFLDKGLTWGDQQMQRYA